MVDSKWWWGIISFEFLVFSFELEEVYHQVPESFFVDVEEDSCVLSS
ncbi:MAG: hypothetical protein ACYSR5_03640 [Planctomycetota bacterium]